jgi:c-di-GMP phosphodiesterase
VRTLTRPLLTRHPVYDGTGEVYGFALTANGDADHRSAARALVQGVTAGLLDGLAGGGRLVVDVTPRALEDVGGLLPAPVVTVAIGHDVLPTADLIGQLVAFRARGGQVMLRGFVPHDPRSELLAHADLVGVELSGDAHLGRLPTRGHAGGLPLLGEGIDSREAFDVAREIGCAYFRGGVFVGTAVLEGTDPPGFRPVHLALLEAVSRPELDFADLERVTKQDIALTHAFLRYVNAAHFGWRRSIESLAHAFVLLGETAVRSWATLVVLADVAADTPQQLAVTAAVRARFCELLGAQARVGAQPIDLFTLGMFSLIDALVRRPMREALGELPLSEEVRTALLGGDNALRRVLDAVVAYEAGEWDALGEALDALGIDDEHLLAHYLAAVDHAAATFDTVVAPD